MIISLGYFFLISLAVFPDFSLFIGCIESFTPCVRCVWRLRVVEFFLTNVVLSGNFCVFLCRVALIMNGFACVKLFFSDDDSTNVTAWSEWDEKTAAAVWGAVGVCALPV